MRLLGGFLALCGGLAVAFATAAFILALGIVPRVASVSGTGKKVLWYESCIMAGIFTGMLFALGVIRFTAPTAFLALLGLADGIFAGCWTIALGEVLNMYAVLLRRLRIRTGLSLIVWALSLGKTLGALLYLLE